MNYDDILRQLGGFGRFQKRMLALLAILPFLDPVTSYILTFILGDHKYRCRYPGDIHDVYSIDIFNMTSNVTQCLLYQNGSTTQCDDWVYDQSQYTSTIISSFDMVCDKRFQRSHMMVCHYIGLFLGSLTSAIFCDSFGRRPVLTAALIGMFLPNLIRSWVYSVPLVGILIMANGYFSQILYQTAYVLATELVDPSKRVFANFLYYFIFCMGAFLSLLFAYFIRDWRTLSWTTSIPVGVSLIILFFQKESPRWLIAKGKFKKAQLILQDIAKENRVSFDIDISNIKVEDKGTSNTFCAVFKQLLKSKILMCRFGILAFNWFAISMTYYGITMKVGNLGGDVYIYFLISTSAEVSALFICLFIVDRLGRKRVFSASMFLCGICCLCTIFTSLYGGPSLHWITIALAMIGKLAITVAYFNIYLIISENFPTVLRSFVLGICSCSGRVGAMLSAYVGDLGVLVDTTFGVALPLIIFGAFAFCAAMLSLLLPETGHASLPQTIEEAEQITRRRYKDTDGKRTDVLMTKEEEESC